MKLSKKQEIDYRKKEQVERVGPYDGVVFGMGNALFDDFCERLHPARYLDSLDELFRNRSSLFMGRTGERNILYVTTSPGASFSSRIFERYLAHGPADEGIGVGYIGATQGDVRVGDIIIPTEAIVGEGTTKYYFPERPGEYPPFLKKDYQAKPSPKILDKIIKEAQKENVEFKTGPIYTTDSLCMETPDMVRDLRKRDILGIDMETSCLFSVADSHKKDAAAILVVSDNQCTHHAYTTDKIRNGIEKVSGEFQKTIEIATKALNN
jgi:purine-nucleoside phosphorylase